METSHSHYNNYFIRISKTRSVILSVCMLLFLWLHFVLWSKPVYFSFDSPSLCVFTCSFVLKTSGAEAAHR